MANGSAFERSSLGIKSIDGLRLRSLGSPLGEADGSDVTDFAWLRSRVGVLEV